VRRAVCVLIQNHEGLVLAIDRSKKSGVTGDYGFPGGKVEPGEHLVTAALRETLEETGLRLFGFSQIYENADGGGFITTTYRPLEYAGDVVSSDEGEVVWVEPAKLVSRACTFRKYNKAVFDAARIRY
jgi:8-oxo-dGTP diphosphatase